LFLQESDFFSSQRLLGVFVSFPMWDFIIVVNSASLADVTLLAHDDLIIENTQGSPQGAV
jgi:hypothetical protein